MESGVLPWELPCSPRAPRSAHECESARDARRTQEILETDPILFGAGGQLPAGPAARPCRAGRLRRVAAAAVRAGAVAPAVGERAWLREARVGSGGDAGAAPVRERPEPPWRERRRQ